MNEVGLLVEGAIDQEIVPHLLESAMANVPSFRKSPVGFKVVFPPNGYGQTPKHLRTLVELYRDNAEMARIGCDLLVVVHDSRATERVRREIRAILRSEWSFPAVYGLAIQEIEAWVLGDALNVNRHVFKVHPHPRLPCKPERDADPRRTLNDLFVRRSTAIPYDSWNRECARLVAPHIRHNQLAVQCSKGFGTLLSDLRAYRRRETVPAF